LVSEKTDPLVVLRWLRFPMKRVGDGYVRVSYEEAVQGVASALRRIMDAHGPDAIASYIGNPVRLSVPRHLEQDRAPNQGLQTPRATPGKTR